MSVFEAEEFVEFVHRYEDGDKVVMRGLYAAPFVVKKYRIAPGEVAAFTSWHGGQKAVTVFHFHPDYTMEEIRPYMENHLDGKSLLEEVRAERSKLSGFEWFEMVQASGVWGEVVRASLGVIASSAKGLVTDVLSLIQAKLRPQEFDQVEVSARALSLGLPPKPPITAAKFPVVLFPKPSPFKVEGVSDELAILAARHAVTTPVSPTLH